MTTRDSSSVERLADQAGLVSVREVLQALPGAIVAHAADGRITMANTSAEGMFGYDSGELCGHTIERLIAPAHRSKHARHRASLIEQPRPLSAELELWAIRKDGFEFPIEISLAEVHTGEGTLFLSSVHDLSDRLDTRRRMEENERIQAQLEERAEHLRIINEFALSLLQKTTLDDILWDIARNAIAKLGFEDCVVYLVNEDATGLIQKAAHGPKNPVAQEILNPIVIPVGQGIVGTVAATGLPELIADTRADSRYIEDDAMRLSELAVPLIHEGRVIGVLDSEHHACGFYTEEHKQILMTIASIASTKIDTAIAMSRLEETVVRLTEAEHKLEQNAVELRAAKEAAEKSSRAKSDFLANMSHEIRTPMTAIVGYAELLIRGDIDEDERRVWAEDLRRNADHLLALVNDVLDLSKIEAGELAPRLEACLLDDVVSQVEALMRPRALEKGLEFVIRRPPLSPGRVITDELRLRQILVNLVSNAIKFTDSGSVVLETSPAETKGQGRSLSIRVSDTGRGIPADDLGAVFQPFTQADQPRDGGPTGTGLGLSIAQRFARLLGGDLTVSSKVGRGCTFTLTVDIGISNETSVDAGTVASPATTAAERSEPDANSLRGRRIHVVEDSPAISEILKHLLEHSGAVVTHSANGAQGVERILAEAEQDDSFDLVLMDMMMPVLDGYAATRTLREKGVRTPIVALTAFAMSDDRAMCKEAGCDDYLTKPISPELLLRTIQERLPADPPQQDARTTTACHEPRHPGTSVADELLELRRSYAGQLPGRQAELRAVVADSDVDRLKELLHKLKGAGGTYGFPRISEAAAECEQVLRATESLQEAGGALVILFEVMDLAASEAAAP